MKASPKKQIFLVMGCVVKDQCVLMTQRNEPDHPEIHGKWELPGGKLEFGEDPGAAAEREIQEETGIISKAIELLPFPYTTVREKDKTRLNPIVLCYLCKYFEGVITANFPSKISSVEWIHFSNLNHIDIQIGSRKFLSHVFSEIYPLGNDANPFAPRIEYLGLESINPEKNQRKAYDIFIQYDIRRINPFLIKVFKGRIGAKMINVINEQYKSEELMHSKLREVLRRRFTRNYEIVKKSEGFPYLTELDKFSNASQFLHNPNQLSFFE